MRKIMAVLVALGTLALMGCEPSTVTATPSTLRPKCREITTVTGVGTPAAEIRNVVMEYQPVPGGEWKTYYWFRTGAPGEGKTEIRKSVNADGTYSFTYAQPQINGATMRFRVRGTKYLGADGGPVSTSWYVTPPKSSDC